METDEVNAHTNKRRRVGNHVYVGSTNLSYRCEHMEVTYMVLLSPTHVLAAARYLAMHDDTLMAFAFITAWLRHNRMTHVHCNIMLAAYTHKLMMTLCNADRGRPGQRAVPRH